MTAIGPVYDATNSILDLEKVRRLLESTTPMEGSWTTKQPWYGSVNYTDNQWHLVITLGGVFQQCYSNDTIYGLIDQVIEERGK